MITQASVFAFLTDAATHGGVRPTRIDTHGAAVFLAGNRAYKIKREVTYPYMDFGSLEKRRTAIAREFELNRRSAPSLYLGVGGVKRAGGALVLDVENAMDGELVEPVLVLRRFDQSELLADLAERRPEAFTPSLAESLADAVIAFHRDAEKIRIEDAAVRFGRIIDGIHVDTREIGGPFARDGAAFAEKARAQLRPLRSLLNERGRSGAVLRGHGDLHLGNIVLWQGKPTLFDCIEFNEDFAIVDRLYDLAFLLMDLSRRGLVAVANRVLNRWCDAFGDEAALGFLPLALSTRAMVRASILPRQALLAAEPGARARLSEESFATAAFAMACLERKAPRLVAIGGLSGTGKSVLAAGLAPSLPPLPGARVLRSDVIRKSLHGLAAHETLPQAAYTKEQSARVYTAMIDRARIALEAGRSVVLDAVFADPAEREAAEALAAETGIAFTGLFLTAGLSTRAARVTTRAHGPRDASDADAAVARAQESYDTGPLGRWRSVDAAGTPAETLAAAQVYLSAATNG